jgi:hypothetical protein
MSDAPMDPESARLVLLIARQIATVCDVDSVIIAVLKRGDAAPTASVQLACYGRTEDGTAFSSPRIPKVAALLQAAITMLISVTGGSVELAQAETPLDLPPEG